MAVEYLNVKGITDAAKKFRDTIGKFDDCIVNVNKATNAATKDWDGKGYEEFTTQMQLMMGQLDDISESLYDIYNALVDAETGYIDQDEAVAKQFAISGSSGGGAR